MSYFTLFLSYRIMFMMSTPMFAAKFCRYGKISVGRRLDSVESLYGSFSLEGLDILRRVVE